MMKSLLEKDELNRLFTEYYEPMDISEEQKKERVELAEDLFDAFLFAFLYIDTQLSAMVSVDVDVEEISEMVTRRYSDAVENYGIKLSEHPELETYIQNVSADIVDSTLENSDKKQEQKDIEEHAVNVAQNEANTIFNRYEYDLAVNGGFFNKKIWITEFDDKVRSSHRKLDFKEIDINEPFEVGESLMLFPKDTSLGASLREIVNCRCSIIYKRDKKSTNELKDKSENDNISPPIFLNLQLFADRDKQYGTKIGKHARDYGLDPSKAEDRDWIYNKIDNIIENSQEIRIGTFRGQTEEVLFHLKGEDVVLTKLNGEFITIMKGGINNGGFKNARKYTI